MNEGIGSTTIVVIIVVFITAVSAYMAYNVNYTKAFRMKNKIISLYEEYDGDCNTECQNKILEYSQSIGYNASDTFRNAGFCEDTNLKPRDPGTDVGAFSYPGYCIYRIPTVDTTSGSDIIDDCAHKGGYYYRVVTRIDIRIPVVQNVYGLRVLNVTGDTKVFKEC